MTSTAAAVAMWVALFFPGQIIDPASVSAYPYNSMEECEESASVFMDMARTNTEFAAQAQADGYEGLMVLCSDDPDPFNLNDE